MNIALTHEEIAQIVGFSRETVTHTLSDLRHKSPITTKGPTVLNPQQASGGGDGGG